tara:strand:- start:1803 stop:2078 length:276 start_codon:yes stop_codon:yes gene_type:complete
MPCIDGRENDDRIKQEKIDNLTALLCKACTLLDESGDLGRDGELTAWYGMHVQQDYERISELMRDSDVISKLDIKTLRAIESLIDGDLDKS